MSNLPAIGHGLFAGYVGDNLAIDCYWPDESAPPPRGFRVVVQRADVPGLLRVILGDDEYARTVAPRLPPSLMSEAALRAGIVDVPIESGVGVAETCMPPPARPAIGGSGEALWLDAVTERMRHGANGAESIHDADAVLAAWRRQFAPTRPGEGEGVKP